MQSCKLFGTSRLAGGFLFIQKRDAPYGASPTSAVPGLPIKREHGVRLPHTCRESLLAKTTLKTSQNRLAENTVPERGRGTNHHSVKRGVSAASLWMAVLAPVKRRSSPATSSAACSAVAKGRGGIASTLITAFVVSGINLLRLPFFQHHARQNTSFVAVS